MENQGSEESTTQDDLERGIVRVLKLNKNSTAENAGISKYIIREIVSFTRAN